MGAETRQQRRYLSVLNVLSIDFDVPLIGESINFIAAEYDTEVICD